VPPLRDLGYRPVEVANDARRLGAAPSRHLVLSDLALLPSQQALSYHPSVAAFLTEVRRRFCEVVHFENSQKLLGLNAKVRHAKLPFDWLYANPRITILERRVAGRRCAPFQG